MYRNTATSDAEYFIHTGQGHSFIDRRDPGTKTIHRQGVRPFLGPGWLAGRLASRAGRAGRFKVGVFCLGILNLDRLS